MLESLLPKTWRKSWFGSFGPLVIQRRLVLTARPWAVVDIVSTPLRRYPCAAKGDHRVLVSSAMALTRWMAVATSSANPVTDLQSSGTQPVQLPNLAYRTPCCLG
jgi:hypothetical protein